MFLLIFAELRFAATLSVDPGQFIFANAKYAMYIAIYLCNVTVMPESMAYIYTAYIRLAALWFAATLGSRDYCELKIGFRTA
jgi:hypothetical protein